MQTILQNVEFPVDGNPDVLPLYADPETWTTIDGNPVRLTNLASIDNVLSRSSARVRSGQRVSYATYFNAFPASYWQRWTIITEVTLTLVTEGTGTVIVYRSNASGDPQQIESRAVEGDTVSTFALPLTVFGDGGWYWFDVSAGDTDVTLVSGTWSTDATPTTPGKLSIGMTTYNKPDYCVATLKTIAEHPALTDALDRIFLVDQGTQRVRDEAGFDEVQSMLGDQLQLIEQGNLGGSGGFSRSMAETLEREPSDFLLLLDDDIEFEPESALRAHQFGRFSRTPTIVGGHMFDLLNKPVLHAWAEVVRPEPFMWGPSFPEQHRHDFRTSNLRQTPWMHARLDADYNGWWMCMIPKRVIEEIGLSIPVFIKWDDAEYGLRAKKAGFRTVSLPGVALWHVSWLDKDDTQDWGAYFHTRNRVIAGLLHSDRPRGGKLLQNNGRQDIKKLLNMQYYATQLAVDALRDVLRGPHRLHETMAGSMPQARAKAASFPETQVYRSGDPSSPVATNGRIIPSLDRERRGPSGARLAIFTARAVPRHWMRTERESDPLVPDLEYPKREADWWRVPHHRSVVVGTADGSGKMWYRHDRLEAEWEAQHPGEALGPVMTARLQGIAWTHHRPGKKPADLKNEQWWQKELADAGYDTSNLEHRAVQSAVSLDDLAVQEVASRALDRCAAGASAWTRHTIQEQVTRITTEYGVHAAPDELREFITLATELAVSDCFSVLPPGAATPEHVAHLTSLSVVAAETALRDQLTAAVPADESPHPDVTEAARTAGLDEGQTLAAAAVASTDQLVIVEGAAGSGKTTMLHTAITVAAEQGRASRVVAPTLRAAQVAEEKLEVPATSIAALVHAHGWRWNADGVWTRLAPGDTDPATGRIYTGPPADAVLRQGERVIVDEAGMLDQDTAHALLTITQGAGATVALVGDRAQLPAVGRGGVLDIAAQIRGRTYDMTELHRFTDTEYAALTLSMRDRENPGEVFDRLTTQGLVTLHPDDEQAREHITNHTQYGEAITVATNDEAAALNERIRSGRVERGEVDDAVTATGSDGLPIGRGDVIQTRKNDGTLGVANRQQWFVQHVTDDGTVYARETSNGRTNPRTVALPAEYVAEHAHLSYAATAYGVQGATVTASHTVLSETTSAAGVYVGMTRGRETNRLHVIAEDMADARAQFIDALERDTADRGLDHATVQAVEAVRGLIKNGPVQLVTEELARLDHDAEQAERQVERWERITARLDAQRAAHRAEAAENTAALHMAKGEADRVRVDVAVPLTVQAEHDGAAYLAAVETEAAASARLATTGRFGRRKARAEHHAATEQAGAARVGLRATWDELPSTRESLPEWAAQAAARRAKNDPRVSAADRAVETAHAGHKATQRQHQQERLALLASELGADEARRDQFGMRTVNPHRNAQDARARATLARVEADELRSLPAGDAARRIEAKRAEQEQARQRAAQRALHLDPFDRESPRHDPGQDGPVRGL